MAVGQDVGNGTVKWRVQRSLPQSGAASLWQRKSSRAGTRTPSSDGSPAAEAADGINLQLRSAYGDVHTAFQPPAAALTEQLGNAYTMALDFQNIQQVARFLVSWQLINVSAVASDSSQLGQVNWPPGTPLSAMGDFADPFPVEPRAAWLQSVQKLAELAAQPDAPKWRLTPESLTAAGHGCEMLLQVVNNCVYIDRAASRRRTPIKSSFFPALLSLLRGARAVTKGKPLPNVAFAVYTPDQTSEAPTCAPHKGVFGYSRRTRDHGMFMLPWVSWNPISMQPAVREMQAAGRVMPYAQRKRAAIWRGSTTNLRGKVTAKTWHAASRGRLVLTSKMHPELLDAQFTSRYAQTPDDVVRALVAAGTGFAQPVPMARQLGYRYMLDVEGNSFSDRLRLLLHGNSTVFKQEYEWLDFFTPALQPWQHYVPVAQDLHDLVTQLRWANANEEDAAAIAARGTSFAERFLHVGLAHWYTWELLQAYATLLTAPVRLSPNSEKVGCV